MDGGDGLAASIAVASRRLEGPGDEASIARVGRLTVAPVLASVFEAQKESRLRRCLSECYIGREKLVSKAVC